MCARELAEADWQDRDMSLPLFETALTALPAECELVLPFAGGEPLLHRQLSQMVALCHGLGKRTELATNATLLTRRRGQELMAAGLDTLVISLDAASAETYERIRRGGSFTRTCANVEAFLRHKIATDAPVWVVIQMVLLPENAHEVEALFRRWRRHPGVDAVRVKADEVNVASIQSGQASPRRTRRHCHFPWLGPLMVRHDGRVYPCCHAWQDEPVGRIGHGNVRDLWNSQAMARLRQAHRQGDLSAYPACQRCQALSPAPTLVAGSLLMPPHLVRRAIPVAEQANRLVRGRFFRMADPVSPLERQAREAATQRPSSGRDSNNRPAAGEPIS
jgi:radical SAM protein with 4Fe4S-binding SPASM domain